MIEGDAPDVVLVDHYDSYTWNLAHLVAKVTGVLPTVVTHDAVAVDDLRRFSHVVLGPGPGHPGNTTDFSLDPRVFELDVPVLGVCLGMQALVHFSGGVIARAEPAHGVVSQIEHDATGIFRNIPSPFPGVRYHSLAAVSVPDVLRVTAWLRGTSTTTDEVMAVEHRTRPLWGVQFHPESILTAHGADLIANFLA